MAQTPWSITEPTGRRDTGGGGQRQAGQLELQYLYAKRHRSETVAMMVPEEPLWHGPQRAPCCLQEIKDRPRISVCLAVFSVHSNKVAYQGCGQPRSYVICQSLKHEVTVCYCALLFLAAESNLQKLSLSVPQTAGRLLFDLQTSGELTSALEHWHSERHKCWMTEEQIRNWLKSSSSVTELRTVVLHQCFPVVECVHLLRHYTLLRYLSISILCHFILLLHYISESYSHYFQIFKTYD